MRSIGNRLIIMGLLSFIFGGNKKPMTKADWDKEIMSLNHSLAVKQSSLAYYRSTKSSPYTISRTQGEIASIKARIANAKIERRNAPK